jgi:hypothetical protein
VESTATLTVAAPNAPATAPAGAVQSSLDDFFDSRHAGHAGKAEPGIPTIVHDGQSHTLH